ncbi:MAG: site-specific integrase [Phycisphaerae bacterium]|nr:site-specific integrase [Phycisphaerae bacterium]
MRVYRQTVKKDGQTVTAKKWYADVRLPGGKRHRLPLFESKSLSEKFAAMLEAMIGQFESGGSYDKNIQNWLSQVSPVFINRFISWGLVDAARAEGARPIKDHIEDYIDHLRHKGNTEPYCKLCNTRIQNVIDGCKTRKLADLSAVKIQRHIGKQLSAGRLSQGSFNHYIRQMKGFLRWLYREDRIQSDIDKHLHLRTVTEIVKDRRALSIEEISYLLDWLQTKAGTRRRLTGWERAVLYKLALTTGLRADEIRHLTAASVDVKAKTVTVQGAYTKNRREAVRPLRDDVLADLQTLIKTKTPDAPLFKYITDKTAELLRADMDDARAQWIQDGGSKKDDFLKADTIDGEIDFHALRHSFATLLINGGADVKTAQTLLRHSTPMLTLGVYARRMSGAGAAAVDALPSFRQKPKKKKKA